MNAGVAKASQCVYSIRMSAANDDRSLPEQPSSTAEGELVPPDTPGTAALTIAPAGPLLVDAEMLLTGLRHLQERLPDYIHLTAREARGMGRAANLDEDFMNAGIQAATVWGDTKRFTGWTGEEMRQIADETRRWDDVERELRIVLKGISDGNLKRKNDLGNGILMVYLALGRLTKMDLKHLRPYYDEMKAAWLRSKRPKKKKP